MHVRPVFEHEYVVNGLLLSRLQRIVAVDLSAHVVSVQRVATRPLEHVLDRLQAFFVCFSSDNARAVALLRAVHCTLTWHLEILGWVLLVVVELAGKVRVGWVTLVSLLD